MDRFFKILLVLSVIFVNVTFLAQSESDKGTWKIHTVFNENKKRVIDAGDKVYCLTDNYLNAYNKKTGSWEGLTKLNRLSDFHVNNIYYNAQKNYLVVTYNNFNIDILLEKGRTINIPNLKEMTTTTDKTINDVTFGANSIYVASKTGYLVIDDKDFKVTKSALFDSNVASIAEVGNYVLVANGSNVFYTTKSTNFKSLTQLTSTGLDVSGKILPVSKSQFFLQSNYLYLVTINGSSFTKTTVSKGKPVDVQVSASGFIAHDNSYLYEFESNGNKKTEVALSAELKSALITSIEADGSVWRLGNKGLKKVSSSGLAVTDELVPNSVTTLRVGEIEYNKYNKKIYVTNGGVSSTYIINDYSKPAHISSYDGKNWKNEVPEDMKGNTFQDPYESVFDPEDPETFYVGTWFQGMYKIKNGELIEKFDWTNSPLVKALNWYCNSPCIRFDTAGNMWTLQYSSGERENDIAILKKENLNKELITSSDWVFPEFNKELTRGMCFLISKDNYKIIFEGNFGGNLNVFTDDENLKNMKLKTFSTLVDQEGKKVKWNYILDLKEDDNGIIWLAYTNGIVGFNPKHVFNDDFKVVRPRSKKDNDKYILDNTFTTCISIDDYNRKWIGTLDGGFYLLNEDCTEVLKYFDIYNSCLPNNKIHSICWNPGTQSVFVGVNGGLIEYKPETYNAVKKFCTEPRTITPDFNGSVKFLNVPEKATLTIKNSEGIVIKTIEPSGLEYEWNYISDNDIKIKTGVYTVTASVKGNEQQEFVEIYVIK